MGSRLGSLTLGWLLIGAASAVAGAVAAAGPSPSTTAPAADAGAAPVDAAAGRTDGGAPAPPETTATPRTAGPDGGITIDLDAALGPAAAPAPAIPTEPDYTEPYTRRGGFTLGLGVGATYGYSEGYPNDLNLIGVEGYRARTAGFGSSLELWLGGALTDWFTVAIGVGQASLGGERMYSSTSAVLFKLEAFPLFAQGGALRDLGLAATFGTGGGFIHRRSDETSYSGAGSLSVVGFGAFWEPLHLSAANLAAGPFVAWQYQSSQSYTSSFAALGLRAAFYGAP
jgi:hypothetical protein